MVQLKFNKIQFKDKEWDGHHINIRVIGNTLMGKIKIPRKVRNRVANFFGEPIEIAYFDSTMHVQIIDAGGQNQSKKLFEICLMDYIERFEPSVKNSMVNENQILKVYWEWKTFEHSISRKSSDLSRDLQNIDTPTRLNYFSKEDSRYRIYSPMPQRKSIFCDQVSEDQFQIQSEQGETSPNHQLRLPKKNKSGFKIYQVVLTQRNKQSEKTRSMTQEKKTKKTVVESKKSGKEEIKSSTIMSENPLRKKIHSIADDNPTLKKRSSSKSSKINTTGAAVIGTFGALLGIFGGMVCERGF